MSQFSTLDIAIPIGYIQINFLNTLHLHYTITQVLKSVFSYLFILLNRNAEILNFLQFGYFFTNVLAGFIGQLIVKQDQI